LSVGKIRIINVQGEVVWEREINGKEGDIAMGNLSKGTYTIEISSGGSVSREKIIFQ
jgi:hypothetical protein